MEFNSENLNRIQVIIKNLQQQKIKITIDNIIKESLFASGGTFTDEKEIDFYLSIIEAQQKSDDNPEEGAKFYFAPNYNLTKKSLQEDIVDHYFTKKDLTNKRITPSRVVGTGYKNPRKVAFIWLNTQIKLTAYLLQHFDKLNQEAAA